MESSISVTVRVRPFTAAEQAHLQHNTKQPMFLGDGSLAAAQNSGPQVNPFTSRFAGKGIRKIINVVDDKMLIFDPPESSPMAGMHKAAFPGQTHRIREHRFVFDQLFDEDATQEQVYNSTTRPLLNNIFDGYNATVFAYGATGCGKTHTISGRPEAPGVVFLTMKELFDRIDELQDTKVVEVTLSYLEIYNETIKDLLEPSNKVLTLREDADKKISVSNLSSHRPNSVQEVMDMILVGNQNRTMSPTEANATSSRSHAVLQINVVQRNRTAELSEAHTFATLSIIDLAGSERASATKNRGERLLEGANINKSLLALGNCINALCDPKRRQHVPYRNSKLTRLLKFSLGGNCKTVMIVCVSPSSQHYDETLNTLKYADRAKMIKTKVVRNQHSLDRHVGSYLKMITEQRAEIEDLRKRETSAITAALAKQETVRSRVREAIREAITSLDTTYSKTAQETEQRVLGSNKMRVLQLQQSQVQEWLDLVSGADFGALQSVYPDLSYFRQEAERCLNIIDGEMQDINTLLDGSCTRDMAAQSTVDQCLRRLRELEGWSEAEEELFMVWAEQTREHHEREYYEQVSQSIVVSDYFGPVIHAFMNASLHMIQKVQDEEFVQMLHNGMMQCTERFLDRDSGTFRTAQSTSASNSASTATPNFSLPKSYAHKRTVVVRSPVQIPFPPKDKPLKRVRWAPSPGPSVAGTPRRGTPGTPGTPGTGGFGTPGTPPQVQDTSFDMMSPNRPGSASPSYQSSLGPLQPLEEIDFGDAASRGASGHVTILGDGESRANASGDTSRSTPAKQKKFGIRGSLRRCVSNNELQQSPGRGAAATGNSFHGNNKENSGLGLPSRVTPGSIQRSRVDRY